MLDLNAFGAMIRDARLARGWRPIDLALAMRWSGTAPVYRYERGGPDAPRPDPDTVNFFAQNLELDYADRITLLGFAGHIPDTEPLSPAEEERLSITIRPQLEPMPEPALVFDYQWRIREMNAAMRRLSGIGPADAQERREREITTLDWLWDPALRIGEFEELEQALRLQLLRFKLFNRLRRHEAWYRAYPDCRAYYPGFVDLWNETELLLANPQSSTVLETVAGGAATVTLPNGTRFTYEASQRTIHGAYGLLGLLVFTPIEDQSQT